MARQNIIQPLLVAARREPWERVQVSFLYPPYPFLRFSRRSTGLGILPIGSVGIVIGADLAILYRVAQSIIDLFGVHNNRPSNFPFSSRNDASGTFPSEYVLPGSGRSCGTCQLPSPRVSRSLLIQSGRRSGGILTGLCVDCSRKGPHECVYPLPC